MPRWSTDQVWGARLCRFGRQWRRARGKVCGRQPSLDPGLPHGAAKEPEFSCWRAMWRRCTSPKHRNYDNYGGRGITVCDRWRSYMAFKEDMGPRPAGMSIDRRDNNQGYEPSNCRWATSPEQLANRRRVGRRPRVAGESAAVG